MKKSFESKYHEKENDHFWFKARRKYILQLLQNSQMDVSILDIGCSSGILLNDLANSGFKSQNLYGIDISPAAIKNSKNNGLQNTFVMDAQNIELNKQFDIIIASDCLEHLKDDDKALKNWNKLLKTNGLLLVFVPAFNLLWSRHDEENMHYRRYTKTDLVKKLKKENFGITRSGYWNFSLFIPVLLIRSLSKINVFNRHKKSSDLDRPNTFNNLLFHLLNTENKLLKHINFPFGISTYCVAKKPINQDH